MKRNMRSPPGWVPLKPAADRMGMHFETLRSHVKAGEFTRLRKTAGERAAIYVPEEEVAAAEIGGIEAVRRLRKKAKQPAKQTAS